MVMEMDRVLTHDIPLLLQKVTKGTIFDNKSSHINLLSNSYLPLYTHTIYVFITHSFPLSLSYTQSVTLFLPISHPLSISLPLSIILSLSFSSFLSLSLSLSLSLFIYLLISHTSYFSLSLSRPRTLLLEGISRKNNSSNNSNMHTPIPTILNTSHRNNSRSRGHLLRVTSGEHAIESNS